MAQDTQDIATQRVNADIGRYGIVRESDGTYSVVDRQAHHAQLSRYPFHHVGQQRAWREAIRLEREYLKD